MTSDFDNDEIQDSAFPVDFNDDTSSLDLYGVWVKSGPRDADLLAKTEAAPSSLPEFSAAMSDYSDISLLPDLPDFSGLAEADAETVEFSEDESLPDFDAGSEASGEESSRASEISVSSVVSDWDDANISFDEIVPDFSVQDDYSEVTAESGVEAPSISERAPSEFVSESEFDSIDTVNFHETPEEAESTGSFTEDTEIIFEDILSDELESSSIVAKKEVPSKNDTFKEPAVSRVFESVDIFEIDEPEMAQEVLDENIQDEYVPDENVADETVPEEPAAERISAAESAGTPDEMPEFSDSPEFDLDDSFGTESVSFDSETFELEGPGTLPTDTSDLDSFISDFNESGGTAAEEKDKLFSGLDPVDIDLDFDESFISDAEKIKATGSAVTKSEFLESEFGVEMIEETASSESTFDESSVIDADFLMSGPKQAFVPDVPADIQDTDEFDELLESLDRAPSPVQSVKQEDSAQKKLYDLSVNEDEGEEILDIPVIKDYNRSDSDTAGETSVFSPFEGSASLDFDDISAVEQELNDSTPDTGDETVNDKSTQLLMMIADELSSIKQELSTLKTEIAGFKASGNPPEQGKTEIDDTDNSGFFNDDDTDETIALTGDELNNILITADFTEEKNEETEAAGPDEQDLSFGGEGETPEISFETPVDMNDFNGFSADLDENDIPDTLPDSIFEATGLESPISVQPAHVNKIDEDTSYLEGSDLPGVILDDLTIDEPDLEIIDFNDEKLEEPELDEFNIDLSAMDNAFPAEQEVSIPREEAFPETLLSTETAFPEAVTESEPAGMAEAVEEKATQPASATGMAALPVDLKDEIKSVLAYMDQLLESLPEEKIEEFARSEHFEVYRKLFEELGIS